MYRVKFGHHDDGTPWLETVGDYNPKHGVPYYHPGNPRSTAETLEEFREQVAVRIKWTFLAGLTDENGIKVRTAGDTEPEYVDIIFPDLSEEDTVDYEQFTMEDVGEVLDYGLVSIANKILFAMEQAE